MSEKFSFIEPHEEQEAKDFIEKHLGFPAPRCVGWQMAVKIYIREEDIHEAKDESGKPILGADGKPIKIYLPSSIRTGEKFISCVGLVVSQGPDCYKGERFKESGPWCKVGDWVMFPRHEGTQISYRGIPMFVINDDKVKMVVEDPTYVTRD